jgi:hypothetical protein
VLLRTRSSRFWTRESFERLLRYLSMSSYSVPFSEISLQPHVPLRRGFLFILSIECDGKSVGPKLEGTLLSNGLDTVTETHFSQHSPLHISDSIMMYGIPKSWTTMKFDRKLFIFRSPLPLGIAMGFLCFTAVYFFWFFSSFLVGIFHLSYSFHPEIFSLSEAKDK